MIRRVSLLVMICLTMSLVTGCLPASWADPGIAVIDTAKVFKESNAGKLGVKFLGDIQASMQAEINKLQAVYQSDQNNVHLQQQLQAVFMQFQQRMGAEQQNVANMLNELLKTTVTEYRAANDLKVVLTTDNLLAYDNTIDISAEIIAALNNKKVSFKPLVAETPAQHMHKILESMPAPEPTEEEKKVEE